MLATQYKASDHALTQSQIAKICGSKENRVPILYGQLASYFCKQLRFTSSLKWKVLSSRPHDGRYKLHPQVVQAIAELVSEGVNIETAADTDSEPPTPPTPPPNATPEEREDYEIENKKAEVQVRQKQSQFRKRVLQNFSHKCCLTGIAETDLLVASHIVPWREEKYKKSRLDPANGLCLFVLYDQLFDKGYITIDNKLCVTITPRTPVLSKELRAILEDIEGRQAAMPTTPIRPKFLKYHREKVFQKE